MNIIRELYANLNKTAFWLTFGISVLLITASFVLPPTGQIDPSVLAAAGELFAFATLGTVIASIDKGSNISLQKGDTTINIENDKDRETDKIQQD